MRSRVSCTCIAVVFALIAIVLTPQMIHIPQQTKAVSEETKRTPMTTTTLGVRRLSASVQNVGIATTCPSVEECLAYNRIGGRTHMHLVAWGICFGTLASYRGPKQANRNGTNRRCLKSIAGREWTRTRAILVDLFCLTFDKRGEISH